MYTAQVLAFITALKHITNNPIQKYNIFTGSLSTVQSLLQNNFQFNDISLVIIDKIQEL